MHPIECRRETKCAVAGSADSLAVLLWASSSHSVEGEMTCQQPGGVEPPECHSVNAGNVQQYNKLLLFSTTMPDVSRDLWDTGKRMPSVVMGSELAVVWCWLGSPCGIPIPGHQSTQLNLVLCT